MSRLLDMDCNPKEASTAMLAFIGDAVYSLMVREQLCCTGRPKADSLHKRAVEMVRCKAQADAMERVMDILSDEEKAVFLRGRNSHTAHVPKHAAVADYRAATGMEALMGYLYLCGKTERLRELYLLISQEQEVTQQ